MKCPVCKDVTLLMSEKNGIEIDYCPECRGIWLDRGELDKIIERAQKQYKDYDDDVYSYSHKKDYESQYNKKNHKKKKGSMFSDLLEMFGGEDD